MSPIKLFLTVIFFFNILYTQGNYRSAGVPFQKLKDEVNHFSTNSVQKGKIQNALQKYIYDGNRDSLLLLDPLGGGMMNLNEGGNSYISYYPDVNRNIGAVINYTCDFKLTSDQLTGTHSDIGGFYYMDEMLTPVLAAADGIIAYVEDGNFDRWQFGNNSQNANSNVVSIVHSGGYYTSYYSLKKNSTTVLEGDTVLAGDTIGYPGSSRQSSQKPHLFFEFGYAFDQGDQYLNPWSGECSLEPSMWSNQLPYMGDSTVNKRQVVQILHTAYPINVDPFDWNTWNYAVWENVPSLKHLNPGEYAQDILIINNLLKTDTLKNYLFLEENLVQEIEWVPGDSEFWWTGTDPSPVTPWFWYGPFNQNFPHGNYTRKFFINDSLIGSNNFIVDDLPNQAPVVESQFINVNVGETVEGEFSALDPDGSIFWYNLESGPAQGTIEIFGGRKRKFRFHAPEDYVGSTTINVSATDDKGLNGSSTLIIFTIVGELGTENQVSAEKFQLSEVFPNPFNPTTQIKYSLPKDNLVNIKIYDAMGRKIRSLSNVYQNAGHHSINWDARNDMGEGVAAGMYILSVQAGEFSASKKMVLLK